MSGKKGAIHKDWHTRPHIVECLGALSKNNNNVKRTARELQMTHQQLRWIAIRAGIKPAGKRGLNATN